MGRRPWERWCKTKVGLCTPLVTPSASAIPFTSSVFPAPRSPSRAMTSPASSTCPRRRPRSRVSSTDAVSTKVLVAGSFDAFETRAVPKPNARRGFDLADDRQRDVDPLEDALRGGDASGRRRADQFEVLRIVDGQPPFLGMQASGQREPGDIDGRPEPRALEQSLELTGKAVADVTPDPDARLDQNAPGDDTGRRIELGRDPGTLVPGLGPAPGFEETQTSGGATQGARDREEPNRPCPSPPENRSRRVEPADQRRREGQQTQRPAEVSAGDRAAEASRLFGDTQVETPDVGNRQGAAQRQCDKRIAWLRAHRRQVAEVDRDQPPAERAEIKARPLQAKINLLDHGVGGRDHEGSAAPRRGIIRSRRNEQPT